MRLLIILVVVALSPIFSYENIIFNYKPNIVKISNKDASKWHYRKLFSNKIIINRLNGVTKISNNYGLSWKRVESIDTKKRRRSFYTKHNSIIINYDNNKELYIGNFKIELVDITGKCHKIQSEIIEKGSLKLFLTNLKNGFYIIRLKNGHLISILGQIIIDR